MFLVLDGNNLAWAGYYALERAMKPEDDDRRRRVARLGLASMALGAIARSGEPPGATPTARPRRVAICFDEGRPIRRRAVYPGYQAARDADPKFTANEPFIKHAIAEFREAAANLPVELLSCPDTEADDLVAGLIHGAAGAPARIVSTDRDFLQLVGSATSIYAPVKKLVIDQANFFEVAAPKTASGEPVTFPMERFLDYRALIGDPSDNLPGVPGIGPLSAARLLAQEPLDQHLAAPAGVRDALGRRSDAVELAFADGSAAEIVGRNRALMDLRLPAPCWSDLDAVTVCGAWDREAFAAWFEDQRIVAVDRALLFQRLEELAKVAGGR
jgi:5'-3' exonuclease